MNRESLHRSLLADRAFYAAVFLPQRHHSYQRKQQKMAGLYQELATLEARLRALEGPRLFPFPRKDMEPDGDWDDMWAYDDKKEFGRHFNDHHRDFGARDWNDYARESQDFYKKSLEEKLPAVETKDGYIKIYDPKTNTFGIYDPYGKSVNLYKPTSPTYFERQIEIEISKGGRIINPLPGPEGSGGGSGGGRGLDPFEKPGQMQHPGDPLPEE